ncbi:MAG: SDR family NAD(P)-dependent oxidoreductase [Saprospiraceae bacterium]|nr:SDR family NAD(P)-dependent oxidoreductase [Saprospiraceae bacterium]
MKKAIIVGATSGIGKGLAEILVEQGYSVGITGRRSALLQALKAQNPASFLVRTFDVTDIDHIAHHLDALAQELGGVDLLVVSSGTGLLNLQLDFEPERQTFETNVAGFTCVADWAFRYFEKQGFGHLVAITSVAGLRGNGAAPAYNASKAYQINYLEGLRQKARKQKKPVIITDIRPGYVDTDMAKGPGIFWAAPVEKAARQIFKAIQQERKVAYITKRWAFVAAIYKRIPRWVLEQM